MNNFRKILKRIIGIKGIVVMRRILNHKDLLCNSIVDYFRYKRDSSVFDINSFHKKESEMTLRYHSIEKGFVRNHIKYKFAKDKVIELISYLNDEDIVNSYQYSSNIQSAVNILVYYYKFHEKHEVDIEDYFPRAIYLKLKKLLKYEFDPIKEHNSETYFSKSESKFDVFANSRCSVRDFSGDKINLSIIEKVVDLANTAPSVCNRQPAIVHLLENKTQINEVLSVQGGLSGYEENISQLIVLTCDRNYFYSAGERNQLYIDGGLYLMNLLYALHFYKIVACPAHWGKNVGADIKIRKLLGLPKSEQVICLVAIGTLSKEFATTPSKRRAFQENLHIIKNNSSLIG